MAEKVHRSALAGGGYERWDRVADLVDYSRELGAHVGPGFRSRRM